MRRPHRSIDTFDISLMAVVTKAMGAFLVLMLILLPGYDPNRETATDLMKRLKAISAKIDELSKQLDDPSKNGADLRKNVGNLASQANLSAEVLGKLEALVDKAFADVQRLEAENADQKREIDALNEELRKLKERVDDTNRTVYFSGTPSKSCGDVQFSGVILQANETDYVWAKTRKPIPAELLLHVPWEARGGEVSVHFEGAQNTAFADGGPFKKYDFVTNAFLLMNNGVGLGDYVVVLTKKDPKAIWSNGEYKWPVLVQSKTDCDVTMSTAVRMQEIWSADYPRSVIMSAASYAGAVVSFTSDASGVHFRAPTADEHKWVAGLIEKSVAAQFASPEGPSLIAAQKSKDEAAKKAAEDAMKALEDKNGTPPPGPSDSAPAQEAPSGGEAPPSQDELDRRTKERLQQLNGTGK